MTDGAGSARSRLRAACSFAVLVAWISIACRPEPALPMLFATPQFELVDQQGAPFGSSQLTGKAVLATFIYTSCTDTCPLQMASLAQLQDQLKADGLLGSKVMLIGFTLDPERDSPTTLQRYGERFNVDVAGWRLLSGDRSTLWRLAQDYKLGRPVLLPVDGRNPLVNLGHSSRLILTDGDGQARATYSNDSLVLSDVIRDVKRTIR